MPKSLNVRIPAATATSNNSDQQQQRPATTATGNNSDRQQQRPAISAAGNKINGGKQGMRPWRDKHATT